MHAIDFINARLSDFKHHNPISKPLKICFKSWNFRLINFVFAKVKKCPTSTPLWLLQARLEEANGKILIGFNIRSLHYVLISLWGCLIMSTVYICLYHRIFWLYFFIYSLLFGVCSYIRIQEINKATTIAVLFLSFFSLMSHVIVEMKLKSDVAMNRKASLVSLTCPDLVAILFILRNVTWFLWLVPCFVCRKLILICNCHPQWRPNDFMAFSLWMAQCNLKLYM